MVDVIQEEQTINKQSYSFTSIERRCLIREG